MEKETKEKIRKALQEKGVNKPCHRCDIGAFDIVGYGFVTLNNTPADIKIGGPGIPSVLIACVNCGLITEHALGPLGLMNLVKK